MITEIIKKVENDIYTSRPQRKKIVKALQWVKNHIGEFSFVRMEEADVLGSTGMIRTVDVAVFKYQGHEVFSHSFITDEKSVVLATVGKTEFSGLPISPLPFAFIGFWQLCFRKLAGKDLMDSINIKI